MSFQRLRAKLRLEPSRELFSEICEIFEEWHERDLELGLDYAAEHLTSWDDELRHVTDFQWDWELPIWWPLVRSYLHTYSRKIPSIWKTNSRVLEQITQLHLGGDNELDSLEFLLPLKCLEKLSISCESLLHTDELKYLGNLQHLTTLYIASCESLEDLSFLSGMKRLQSLSLRQCSSVESLHCLLPLERLLELEFSNLSLRGLETLPMLSNLPDLRRLCLDSCPHVQNTDKLKRFVHLDTLELTNCDYLRNVSELKTLTNLSELKISRCFSLKDLDGLSTLSCLKKLNLFGCFYLESLKGVMNLASLEELMLGACHSLDIQLPDYSLKTRYRVSMFQEEIKKHYQNSF